MNKILKPFNIEKAKAGAKLSTKDGEDARIVCWDKFGNNYPTIALINRDGVEIVYSYTKGGQNVIGFDSKNDLMIREDEYEDGDIIAFGDDKDKPTIGIFNYYYDLSKKRDSHNDYCQLECNGTVWHHEVGYLSNSRLATEEEKQKLFDALAKKGKRWNAEKKAIEDVKEENKCEFKRGQAVLVRDNHDSFWKLALFIDYNRNTAYSYLTTSGGKKLCIDYDSHRDLLYQFDNPE